MFHANSLTALSEPTHGVVTFRMLHAQGISRHQVRSHLRSGRVEPLGTHTLRVLAGPWCERRSPIVAAVLDTGDFAWADGTSALILAGLQGWEASCVDVGLPASQSPPLARQRIGGDVTTSAQTHPRIVWHRLKVAPRLLSVPVARALPAFAALRAAAWAVSDRQGATLLAMTAQQRLARVSDMEAALTRFPRLPRRALIAGVLRDIAGGADSLAELDFTAECRRRGIPQPNRQVVRRGPNGRYVLDVYWDAARLVVEIDGVHHLMGDNPTKDALRQNDLALAGLTMMRVPALAVRTTPDPFFAQIARHLTAAAAFDVSL